MADLLATDPGAWNIIGWILVLAVVGAVVLWGITTVLLRSGRSAAAPPPPPPPACGEWGWDDYGRRVCIAYY